MSKLSEQYIIESIYRYAKRVHYNRFTNVYNFECTICLEGTSKGKKRRMYYIPKNETFFCHNCGYSSNAINWLIKASGKSFGELMREANEYNSPVIERIEKEEIKKPTVGTLPEDSINLFDEQQLKYHKNNKVVFDALRFIELRRLNVAINRPRALFISLKDYVHKNRLCIPFYDSDNQIIFYQTRAIYKKDEIDKPKYLSKMGADKSIFGLKNIDGAIDNLFITEGPIDSFFITNGIAMGGIHITSRHEEQLEKYKLLNKIWILDNQMDNNDVKKKMKQLIESGEKMFIWPEKYKEFKDINEMCVHYKLNHISPKFFIDNAFQGVQALLKIK